MNKLDEHLLKQVREAACAHDIDPALVAGVVETESDWQTWAYRFEPTYRWLWPSRFKVGDVARRYGRTVATEKAQQKASWGLMQVMGAVARELGYSHPDLTGLCLPALGLEYGCLYLERLLKRHGDTRAALSAYNSGRPDSRRGLAYADRVLEAAEALRPMVEVCQ